MRGSCGNRQALSSQSEPENGASAYPQALCGLNQRFAETSHWLCSREVTCHTTSVAKGTSARRAAEQGTSSIGTCASKRGRGGGSEGWFGDIWSAKAGWVGGGGCELRPGAQWQETREKTERYKQIKQEQARSRSRGDRTYRK